MSAGSNWRPLSGGTPVEVANQFTAKTGIKILEGYGLTKRPQWRQLALAGELRIGSVGVRLPYQQAHAAQIEDGKISHFCAPNEIGVIVLS